MADIESVPAMDPEQWLLQPAPVWHAVADMVKDGWYGRVHQYYGYLAAQRGESYWDGKSIPDEFLTYPCAKFIQELGAPVGRFFTVAKIRHNNAKEV